MNSKCLCLLFLCIPMMAHFTRPKHDLVDIKIVNPAIQVQLYFASPNNFTKKAIYPEMVRAYFRSEVAAALSAVQTELEPLGLGLLIVDAYRPSSVQQRFPEGFSCCPRHSSGLSVDVLLINREDSSLVCMPSAYLGTAYKSGCNETYCSQEAKQNCAMLKGIMERHGFTGLSSAWWHYDYVCTRSVNHPLDISFDELSAN